MKNPFAIREPWCTPLAAVVTLGLALWGTNTLAQTATQQVSFEVQAINEITVSGDPGALTINTAAGSGGPEAVSDASTTYDITTNETDKTITAEIDTAMPDNVTLTIDMAAPTGATSNGAVTLDTIAAVAVTGISTLDESGLGITYELSATSEAGVVPADTRTVTLTVADSGV